MSVVFAILGWILIVAVIIGGIYVAALLGIVLLAGLVEIVYQWVMVRKQRKYWRIERRLKRYSGIPPY